MSLSLTQTCRRARAKTLGLKQRSLNNIDNIDIIINLIGYSGRERVQFSKCTVSGYVTI